MSDVNEATTQPDHAAAATRNAVLNQIRSRANNARRLAQRGVLGIVGIVVVLVLVFLSFSISIPGPRGPKKEPLSPKSLGWEDSTTAQKTGDAHPVAASKPDGSQPAAQSPKQSEALDDLMTNLTSMTWAIWVSMAEAAIARIASMLLALYLAQVLSGFVRYHFRMADHLDACGDALALSDDSARVGELVATFSPRAIEFGAAPKPPTEHVLDAVRELIAKLPPKG